MNIFTQSFRTTIIAFLTTFLSAAFAQSQQTQVWLLDVRSGERKQLTNLSEGSAANPAFTNNGRYVTYEIYNRPDSKPPTFGIVDVKTEESWKLCEFLGFECDPLGDPLEDPLKDDPFVGANDGRWSPNGNYLLFDGLNSSTSPLEERLNLYVFNIAPLTSDGKIPPLFDPPPSQFEPFPTEGYIFGDWSQDSKKVVFTALFFDFLPPFEPFTKSVRTYNIDTGRMSDVFFDPIPIFPTGPLDTVFNATWSPNGQYIAFANSDFERDFDDPNFEPEADFLGRNIYKIRVNHAGEPMGEPEPVTTDTGGIINDYPSWSNNSKTIVFQSNRLTDDQDTVYDYNLWTIPADGGEPTLLHGEPDTDETDPAFSKNGRWIVYVAPPKEPKVEKARKQSKRR